MNAGRDARKASTFAVSNEGDGWRIMQDDLLTEGRFHSQGDAVRAACFRAREAERKGCRAIVFAQPGDVLLPHYEPHFGL